MKTRASIVMACLMLLSATSAHAQLGNMFRSITGALGGGGGGSPAPAQGGSTATIGIRGMEEGGTVAAAGPASPEAALLDTWATQPADATRAASARGLAARPVTLVGSAPTTPPVTSNNASSNSQP